MGYPSAVYLAGHPCSGVSFFGAGGQVSFFWSRCITGIWYIFLEQMYHFEINKVSFSKKNMLIIRAAHSQPTHILMYQIIGILCHDTSAQHKDSSYKRDPSPAQIVIVSHVDGAGGVVGKQRRLPG